MFLFAQAEAVGIFFILLMVLLGIVGLVVYFLPTFLAAMRGHQSTLAIFVLNLLLGATFIGWVVALVWALSAVEPRR